MTQKELLYLEDAIKHEEEIINILNIMVDNLDDEDNVNFSEKEIKKHESILKKLNNLMEEKANEWWNIN